MSIPVTDDSEFSRWLDANRAEAAKIFRQPQSEGEAKLHAEVVELRGRLERLARIESRVRQLADDIRFELLGLDRPVAP